MLLFLMAWLGGWSVGGMSAFIQVAKPGDGQAFLAFWLVGWAIGEICVLGIILWQLVGLEELSIRGGNLVHRVSIGGLGRTREFLGALVKNLRTARQLSAPWMDQRAFAPPIFGSGYGAIAFDYGAKTYRIGASLDEAEATLILGTLSKKFPRMIESNSAT